MSLAEFVEALAPKVYSGPIRRAGKWLGIDGFLRELYSRLQSYTTPDRVSVSVGDVETTFNTSTESEYRRVTSHIETQVLADFLEELQADDVVWDVGANTGLYTCLAAETVNQGTVVAFEPHPGNVDSLYSNIEINGLTNIETEKIALSDESGAATLSITSEKAGLGLHSLSKGANGDSIEIQVERGDDLISAGYQIPSVVKIDVEGSEGQVIEGMKSTLTDSRCRAIYCEVHASESLPNSVQDYGYTPEDVERAFETAGFDLDRIDDGDTYFLKGTKKQ